MKKKIDLLLAIFLVVISFSFTSCESDPEEPRVKYTYLGELIPVLDFSTPPQESITCIVNDNSVLIKKKNSRFCGTNSEGKPFISRLDVEVSNDTIYLYEKWLNTWMCNTDYVRDENILMTNVPKGKWIVKNVEYYYPNETEEDLTFPTPPGIDVDIPLPVYIDIFSIEIE